MSSAFLLLALLLQAGGPLLHSDGNPPPGRYPFGVGEAFEYSAKAGFITLGKASMSVTRIDTVRGIPAFNFRYHIEGGNRLFRLDDVNESWTSVENLVSLRFHQEMNQNDKHRIRRYEIYPDSGFYRQEGVVKTEKTPAAPVDDAAIVYYLRTHHLEVGKAYRFDNYFKAAKNPLIVRVHSRETMELPDGTKVPCIVLQPMIGDDGLFSNRSDARIWITDDDRRIPVQIRSRLPWLTITLRLEKMTLAPGNGP
ncbi:MAG: DUF3108 domain-containing protein [Gemmatimonadota bacterium]|nr:DUF3108 domain-containing protein [Gemmatimonadota bacterium]